MEETYTYGYYKKAADFILKKIGFEPEIGIILGTGCALFAQSIENPVVISYRDIPNFLVTTNPDHAGKLICGTIAGKKVICMSGRFHAYEGYSLEQLSIPVRVLKLTGIRKLILTNAAGAVNPSYQPGDAMLIQDHIKLFGFSPMRGTNLEEFGPRFFDVTDMYAKNLRKIALDCAEKSSMKVHTGVYMYFPGPQFETPAEIRAARVLGADAIGMSTVTEALTAAHCSLPVLGLCLITNMAAGVISDTKQEGSEVNALADRVGPEFSALLKDIVKAI